MNFKSSAAFFGLPLLVALTAPVLQAEEQAAQVIQRVGSQPSIPAPKAYFTGQARLDTQWPVTPGISASGTVVTFEPGARSYWHTHPAGQRLVVLSGVGYTQEWGKPIQEVHPGDVIWCPPGVKHWHGASAKVAMSHLAVTGDLDGKNVKWMEAVTDAQYAEQ